MNNEQDQTTRVKEYFENNNDGNSGEEYGIPPELGSKVYYSDEYISILFCEPLNFHKEYNSKFSELCLDKEYETTSDEFDKVFIKELKKEILNNTSLNVDIDIYDNTDEEEMSLGISFEYDENKLMSEFAENVYNVLATFTNVTDPGTFGSEYIMNKVIKQLEQNS